MPDRWAMVERKQQARLFKAGWIRGATDPLTPENHNNWDAAYRLGFLRGRRSYGEDRREFDEIRDDSLLHIITQYAVHGRVSDR